MVEVVFQYKGTSSSIQCNESDLLKDIIEKFISKAELDIHKIYFLYGGTIINKELSFKELTKETNEKKISILVLEIEEENPEKNDENKELKKSNIIICPICKDICKFAIENYHIKLYGCENSHTINDISINDFNETQYIDESKIICDNCKLANKKDQYNKVFNYCNTCKQKLCPLCKSKHDKSHTIIDYDKKNYVCHNHNDKFISYCNDCNKNLCCNCQTEHSKIHKIISFPDISYNKEDLSQANEKFQMMIEIINKKIEAILDSLHELKKNIENYKVIFSNIINNSEQDNRNYYILNNIKALFENNINKDLDKIVLNKNINICSDFKILMKMYTKMNTNNISNEFIKNQIGLEIEEFKNEKSWNFSEMQLLQKYGENSICKIYKRDYKKYLGLGFLIQIDGLLKFPFKRGLCTCNNIFHEEFFNNNEYLYFIHKNSNKKISIKECQIFSKNSKYEDFRNSFDKRKIFVDKELDYTFIEILDSDIDKNYELFQLETRNQRYSSDIAILYQMHDKLSFSFGTFQRKNDNSLIHNCFTNFGNIGAPIINLNYNNPTVIGIHSGNTKSFGLGNSMDIISSDIMKNYIKFLYNENSLKNNFTKIQIHNDFITNLILYDENTLCSGSTDGNIILFNANNFELLDIIKEKEPIIYHTKLSNNNIILCCKDGSIKIYKEKSKIATIAKFIAIGGVFLFAPKLTPAAIQLLFENNTNRIDKNVYSSKYELVEILKEHQESVCQVIEMSEDIIISSGLDTKMKIWQKKGSNFTCINTLTVNDEFGSSTNILKIKENEVVSAATKANYIIFWNINTLEAKMIDNIVCHWNRNSMKMIRSTLFIGGDEYNGIYLINVVNYQVTSHIIFEKIAAISTIIRLNNGNILIGCKKENKSEKKEEEEDISYTYSLIEYKYNSKEKTLTEVRSNEDAHSNIITGIIKLNHNEIATCSLDKTIKFWI